MKKSETAKNRKEDVPLDQKAALTPAEAIALFSLGRTRLYQWLRSGELPSVKLGASRLIRRSDLDLFLESRIDDPTR